MPRVSLISPCYNVAPYVERLIASVQRQTYTDWEHILVDDGSTDDTAEAIVRAIRDEPRARLVRQSNRGVCAARNAGYVAASAPSEYVYFPDPDDMLAPDLLMTMIAYMETRPHVSMAHCGFQWVGLDDGLMPTCRGSRYAPTGYGVRRLPDEEPITPFASLYCWAPVPEAVAFIRRSAYIQTTGWDESFGQHGEGVILFPQLALLGEVHYVPAALYRYRVRHGQSSRVEGKQELAERRVLEWWRNATWLTPEQRAVLLHAEWFRYYRLEPWKGVRVAAQELRAGNVRSSLRFALGAARRYACSFTKRPATHGAASTCA